MKFNKTASIITATCLACSMSASLSVMAESTVSKVDSVFDDFWQPDVNGSVILTLPEQATASVKITAVTPEGNFNYYDGNYSSSENSVYSFDIEGYDERSYIMELTIIDDSINRFSEKYTETFSIPDGNDHINSWVDLNYNIVIDHADEEGAYTLEESEDKKDKTITFHIDDYLDGDVNDDGVINAMDATMVLSEYSARSMGVVTDFTEKQFSAGDVNKDGILDSLDATKILVYYSSAATGTTPSWD